MKSKKAKELAESSFLIGANHICSLAISLRYSPTNRVFATEAIMNLRFDLSELFLTRICHASHSYRPGILSVWLI